MSKYAWIITKDHIPDENAQEGTNLNAKGMTGPSTITEEQFTELLAGKGHTFHMYDDDGECYYKGKLFVDKGADITDYLHCPLRDFGTPNAGAVLIKYHGKPEWESEWS